MPSPNVAVNAPGTIYLNYTGTENVGALTINGVAATAAALRGGGRFGSSQSKQRLDRHWYLECRRHHYLACHQPGFRSQSEHLRLSVSFTATVTGALRLAPSSSTITAKAIGSPVTVSGGAATSPTVSNLDMGTANVTAYYLGDANNSPAAALAGGADYQSARRGIGWNLQRQNDHRHRRNSDRGQYLPGDCRPIDRRLAHFGLPSLGPAGDSSGPSAHPTRITPPHAARPRSPSIRYQ